MDDGLNSTAMGILATLANSLPSDYWYFKELPIPQSSGDIVSRILKGENIQIGEFSIKDIIVDERSGFLSFSQGKEENWIKTELTFWKVNENDIILGIVHNAIVDFPYTIQYHFMDAWKTTNPKEEWRFWERTNGIFPYQSLTHLGMTEIQSKGYHSHWEKRIQPETNAFHGQNLFISLPRQGLNITVQPSGARFLPEELQFQKFIYWKNGAFLTDPLESFQVYLDLPADCFHQGIPISPAARIAMIDSFAPWDGFFRLGNSPKNDIVGECITELKIFNTPNTQFCFSSNKNGYPGCGQIKFLQFEPEKKTWEVITQTAVPFFDEPSFKKWKIETKSSKSDDSDWSTISFSNIIGTTSWQLNTAEAPFSSSTQTFTYFVWDSMDSKFISKKAP